jgi:glycosyltransferase involved in cell wall biosynthesis
LEYADSDFGLLGVGARELMEDKYSWERNVEALVEVYKEL